MKCTSQAIESRNSILILFFLILFGGLVVRLVILGISFDRKSTVPQRILASEPFGTVLDRTGFVVSASLPYDLIFVEPKILGDFESPGYPREKLLSDLKRIFPKIDLQALSEKIEKSHSFMILQRWGTPKQVQDVLDLGHPGFGFQRVYRRFRPNENDFSRLLGSIDADGQPTSGLEKYLFDAQIAELKLSIVSSLQSAASSILKSIEHANSIKLKEAIIINPSNGELLAFLPHKPDAVLHFLKSEEISEDLLPKYDTPEFRLLLLKSVSANAGISLENKSGVTTSEKTGQFDDYISKEYQSLRTICALSKVKQARISESLGNSLYNDSLLKLCKAGYEETSNDRNLREVITPISLTLLDLSQLLSKHCFGSSYNKAKVLWTNAARSDVTITRVNSSCENWFAKSNNNASRLTNVLRLEAAQNISIVVVKIQTIKGDYLFLSAFEGIAHKIILDSSAYLNLTLRILQET